MSESIPSWREAMKDKNHPLHRATWLLFNEKMSVSGAARLLEAQKEQVIDYCVVILEAEELYSPKSLGAGAAPLNAVELLGEWRAQNALPGLLHVLLTRTLTEMIYQRAIIALIGIGEPIIDTLFSFRHELKTSYANVGVLLVFANIIDKLPDKTQYAHIFEWGLEVLDRWAGTADYVTCADCLVMLDAERGQREVEQRIRQGRYAKEIAREIRDGIREILDESDDD